MGYFRSDSPIRRIGGESVLMLGGGRALLMQAAHPLVAAGVVQHSDYAADPWRRLARTMTALYTIVFGTKAEADRVGAIVQSVHRRVTGTLAEDVGPWRAGTPYSASDPDLMLWVHATLVDTGIAMHERYVGPLSKHDRVGFYRDMKLVARVFGTPPEVLPRTLRDFEDYRRSMLTGGELAVGTDARAVARTVLRPPVPPPLRPLFRVLGVATVGLLPEPVREAYGLGWGRRHEALLRASTRSSRGLVVPLLPRPLRIVRSERGHGVPMRVLSAFAGGS